MGILSYSIARNVLKNSVIERLDSVANIEKLGVSLILDNYQKKLNKINNDRNFRNALVAPAKLNLVLDEAKKYTGDVNMIMFVDSNGIVTASTNREVIGESVSGENFFKSAKEKNYINPVTETRYSVKTLQVSGPVFEVKNFLGVLIIEVPASSLLAFVQSYSSFGLSGESYFVYKAKDNTVNFVAPPRFGSPVFDDKPDPITSQALSQKESSMSNFNDYRGEKALAVTRFIPGTNLAFAIKEGETEVFSSIGILRTYSLLTFFAVSIAAISVALYLAQLIGDPIRKLESFVKKVRSESLFQVVDITSSDEIGSLAASFNEMTKRLHDLYESLEDKVKQKTSALSQKVIELESAKKEMSELLEELNDSRSLVENEKLIYETTLSCINDIVVVTDYKGCIINLSKEAVALLGLSINDLLNKDYFDVFRIYDKKGVLIAVDKRPVSQVLHSRVQAGTTFDGKNYFLEIKDGVKIPVTMFVTPVMDSGKVVGTISVFKVHSS